MSLATFSKPVWAAPARPAAAPAPKIAVSKSADGTITMSAAINPTSILHFDLLTDTAVTSGTVQGRPTPILVEPGKWTHFVWQASSGMAVTFRPRGHGFLDVRYSDYTPGWPAGAKPLPAMPAGLMAWDMSGSSVATGAMRSTW